MSSYSLFIFDRYEDVFLEELPGISPPREIEFIINLLPDTFPISIDTYRMAPLEFREVRFQLD